VPVVDRWGLKCHVPVAQLGAKVQGCIKVGKAQQAQH